MENWEQKLAEIMEMKDPRKACIAIVLLADREDLSIEIIERAMDEYIKKHGVDLDEMTFYPDGERVLNMETFWYDRRKRKENEELVLEDIVLIREDEAFLTFE